MHKSVQYSTAKHNNLSDRDMLLDLLIFAKGMSHLYDHAVLEASSSKVRDTFAKLQQHKHETARLLYDVLRNHGWYHGIKAQSEQTTRSKTQLERMYDDDDTVQQKSGIGIDARQFARRPDSSYAAKNATRHFGYRMARRTSRPTANRHELLMM